MTDGGTLTQEVVSAVARAEGIDPTAVEPPLFEAVDMEAMERLFRDTRGRLAFEYKDYLVTVSSSGDVVLDPLAT